jgi:hypothetical protein
MNLPSNRQKFVKIGKKSKKFFPLPPGSDDRKFDWKLLKSEKMRFSRVKRARFRGQKTRDAHFFQKMNCDTQAVFFIKIVESFPNYCHDLP